MPLLTPDPTFYPSPTMATQSPPETFAYVTLINPVSDGPTPMPMKLSTRNSSALASARSRGPTRR